MFKWFAWVVLSTPHVCTAQGGQKRASDPLELELQVVVICHVGAENKTQVLCKESCKLMSCLSRPQVILCRKVIMKTCICGPQKHCTHSNSADLCYALLGSMLSPPVYKGERDTGTLKNFPQMPLLPNSAGRDPITPPTSWSTHVIIFTSRSLCTRAQVPFSVLEGWRIIKSLTWIKCALW